MVESWKLFLVYPEGNFRQKSGLLHHDCSAIAVVFLVWSVTGLKDFSERQVSVEWQISESTVSFILISLSKDQ